MERTRRRVALPTRFRVRALVVAAGLVWGLAPVAHAQDASSSLENNARAPRFLVAAVGSRVPLALDVSRTPVLLKRIAVNFDGVTLKDALADISTKSGLSIVFGDGVLPAERRVRLRASQITVMAALTDVLGDLGVDVLFTPGGSATIARRGPMARGVLDGSLSGRVTDAKTKEPLANAEIAIEGTRQRTVSGDRGVFKLADLPEGSRTVSVRRVGYGKRTIAVTIVSGQDAVLEVALDPIVTQLNEIVTTVTGDQRRLELGHVVGVINADSLVKEAPVSTLSELLNGRVPGLQVFQAQGTVGGEVRLQIRGPNSFALNNEPIVIIDGVRYTSAKSKRWWSDAGKEVTSPLNDLSPNDIEAVEVVKGPSAATLYGTDAANGVLVITTKRGKPGPARWNAYAKSTRSEVSVSQFPDVYWGWGTVAGTPNNTMYSCTLARIANGDCTQQDSVTRLPNPLNDPDLSVFGPSPRWEYGSSVAGGRQDVRYFFAADADHAIGTMRMPPAIEKSLMEERGLSELPDEWRDPNVLKKVNLRANLAAVMGETAEVRVNSGYVHSSTRSIAGFLNPYAYSVAYGRPGQPYGTSGATDPAESFLQTSTEQTDRFFGSANGQWRPVPWLITRATVGLDLDGVHRLNLTRKGDAPNEGLLRNGGVMEDRVKQLATTAEIGATATGRWGRVSSRTSVGAQYVRNLNDALSTFGVELPPGGSSVNDAAYIYSGQSYLEAVTLGSYIDQTFGFNERLFLTGAVRVDGASTLGQNYDAVAYPKISASWLISDEPFLPRVPGLNELRVRYAYGASGRQPESKMAQPTFLSTQRAVENGAVIPAMWVDGMGNPGLRPERVREHEFGFDASALTNRLRMELTWFWRRTADQIASTPSAPGMGSVLFTNLGLTTQGGFEASVTARLVDARSIGWDLVAQHSTYHTKLVKLGNGFPLRSQAGGYVEGYSLGARFWYPLNYADANSDGILERSEARLDFDHPIYVGETSPPTSQTLTSIVSLLDRRLRVSALVERRSGAVQINALRQVQCGALSCRDLIDPSTSIDAQARAIMNYPNFESSDFTRLREVSAAFDLPESVARSLRVRSATIGISARNVALWTKFSGPDPESAPAELNTSPVSISPASGVPQSRVWTLRLDLGF